MPNLLDAIRTGNVENAVSSLYDTVEVRTALSPPIRVPTSDILQINPNDPNAKPPWWLSWMKPTVIFSGAGGRQVVAPAGVAGDGTVPMLLIIGAVVGVGFALGRWSK